MRLTISDDHRIVRVGLRAILEAHEDVQVVAEAASVASTLTMVQAEKPDVALLDIHMPDGSGLSALKALRAASPETRFLVLSVRADWDTVREAVTMGAHGYIAKSADPEEIVQAVRSVASGRAFLSVPVEARHGSILPSTPPSMPPRSSLRPPENSPARSLSERERQVLELYARGYTQRQIADSLGLRAKTVETYRGRLGVKFAARSREEIVQTARDQGFLQAVEDCAEE
jgi:two-component system response regulator NreC